VPPLLVQAFTSGFHQAFSIAVADSMWIGVVAASLAFLTTLALKEKPLRAHLHAEQAARMGLRPQAVGAAGGATPGPARPRIDEPAATSADDGLAREW